MIAALTPIRVLLASIALFVLGLVGGFALRTVLDWQQPSAPSFEVVHAAASCPDLTHCTLLVHVRNSGGPGTGEVVLTAQSHGPAMSCRAVIPRAERGDVVEASCPISSTGLAGAPILQNLTVTATIVPKAGLVGTIVLPFPG